MRLRQPLTLATLLLATLPGASALAADAPAGGDGAAHIANAADMNGVDIVPVSSSISMVVVHGQNLTVEYGPDGAFVVDTGAPGDSAAVLAAIRHVTSEPIRFVIDTSASADRVGNNAALSHAGVGFTAMETGFGGGRFVRSTASAPIVARVNVLTAMSGDAAAGYSSDSMPTLTWSEGQQNFSLNGDSIEVVPVASAHTDGDSMVIFRRSDVIVAGDIVDMQHFPQIDVAHGGSIDGEIAALNRLVDIVVPALPLYWHGGGTVVIPARGRLAEAEEIVQYRDMVTIVRDRVKALIDQHRTLAQVHAADPTAGFDSRYGAEGGPWSTDQFVTAVYQSLTASHGRKGAR
jgi:glyoxylase-like metal-dependent hydrolase (beta-lactamase superfamily II)